MQVQNRQYWFKSGAFNLIMNIQSLLFGFGSFYLLVRMLDKNSYGIWALFVATTTILELGRNGLLQNGLIKYLSESPVELHPKILSSSFFLSAVLMLVCIGINISLAGFLANIWHYPDLSRMLYTYNIVYLILGVMYQFQWIEQANLNFTGVLISNCVRQGGLFIYIFGCFLFHFRIALMHLIYVQISCASLATLVQYFFVRSRLDLSSNIDGAWIRKLFNYGKYAFGTSISGILIITLNQMMLGALLYPAAAGAYNVAEKIVSLTEVPTNALGAIVFPQSAKRFAAQGHDAIKYLYEKSVGTILALLIPPLLFLFIFPGLVVHIVAGNNYPETIPIVQVTVLSCLLNPFSRLFGTILDSIGKPRTNFIIIAVFTAFELVLLFTMIRQYGIMGAVYATLIANIFLFIVTQVILKKELRVNVLHTFIYAGRFYPELFGSYIKPIVKR
ncbi:MAG TPA: flippase [Puia sp.]|nr:flippase [Puia sp.]